MSMQSTRDTIGDEPGDGLPEDEFVLTYTDVDSWFGRICLFALFAWMTAPGSVLAGFCLYNSLLMAGVLDPPGSTYVVPQSVGDGVLLTVGFVVGTLYTFYFGRWTVRCAFMCWRSSRGGWWLRLSDRGFEVNDRAGKPRRYQWQEIEKFLLVGAYDTEEGTFVGQVGFQYAPGHRLTMAKRLRQRLAPPRDRDDTKSDGIIMGWWDRPFDDAVDLMNDWLTRCTVGRG